MNQVVDAKSPKITLEVKAAEPTDAETEEAKSVMLAEPLLIPKNPAALIIKMLTLAILAEVGVLVILGFLAFVVNTRTLYAVLVFVQLAKMGLIGYMILRALIPWTHLNYYLSETQLTRKEMPGKESVHELQNIQRIEMKQGWLGRMFDYGDIDLTIAPPGFKEVMHIDDIKDPAHYKAIFEKYLPPPA